MSGLKDIPIKGYAEKRVADAVSEYADQEGLTVSAAVRRLVIRGLKVERVRERAAAEAERAMLSIAV